MRVLVTGGAGFIGSNFIHRALHAAGAATDCCADEAFYTPRPHEAAMEILNVDSLTYAADPSFLRGVDHLPQYRFERADICDAAAMDRIFASFKPEAVVHFAAESHVDRSIAAGEIFVRTNVLGTQTLLDAARRHDVGRFLHVSTDEVYGSIEKGSFTERDRLHAASPYSASKAGSDLLVLAHHTTYGLPVQITRCTNNYGPRQNPEKLLPKTILRAIRKEPIPVYGNGMNVRDWLYVKDHCEGILRVMKERSWGEIYNIGASDEKPNLAVVREVLRRLGRDEKLIQFVADRPGHDWRYSLDSSKLRALGWAPRVDFSAGLQLTIDHFQTRSVPA